MVKHDIKQSFRSLKHHKLISVLNIGGFAAGFAVFMILALYTYKEYTVDRSFPNHSNLYRIIDANKNSSRVDFEFAQSLREQYSDVVYAVPLNYISFTGENVFIKSLTGEDYVKSEAMVSTTNDFFKAFSVPIISGNPDAPLADLNSIVITQRVAEKLFGDNNAVGKTINFADIFELQVSAVCKNLPENSSFTGDVFYNGMNENYRFSQSCTNDICCNPVDVYVQLRAGADPTQFASLVNEDIPANKSDLQTIRLQPIRDIYLNQSIEGNRNEAGSRSMIRIFLSIAIVILLLSVINYVNLSLSKQLATLKEIAIKFTNGAGSGHLRAYYLVDVSLSVFIAFVLAIVIASLALPFASRLLGTSLKLVWLTSPVLLSAIVLVLFSVILVSSFAPVYIVSKFDVQRLFGKTQTAAGKQWGKRMLTVFQLSMAIALLIGLMAIQKQIHFVKSKDLGFDKEQLMRVDIRKDMKNSVALKQRIDQLPFVQNSTLSLGAPGSIYSIMTSDIHDKNNFEVDCINVDENFLKTLDIQLLEGREFEASDLGYACYINETAYRLFGWDNLENRVFNNGRDGGFKILGLVRDFNVASLHNGMSPVCLIYRPRYTTLNIKLMAGNTGDQMAKLKSIWNEFVPGNPMMYTFYDDFFDAFYKKEEREEKAIAVFSIIAFMITGLGLIGQIVQTTNARMKEIGIRKVNGAKVSELMTMLNKDFVFRVIFAFVVAIPIAYYGINKWLENFAYKTEISWWIFASAGLLALGIALLTVSWQSWKAATRNPVEALRYE